MTDSVPVSPPGPFSCPGPWDAVSEGYDAVTRDFLGEFSAVGLAALSLEKESCLLDVACGPGTTTLLAAERVGSIDALDFSPAMLDLCKAHIARRGYQHVRTHLGDGQALPFAAASFDVAVSMFGLMFFPDRGLGMRELRRVLRPGGQVLISSWAPVHLSPTMSLLFGALRAIDSSRPKPETDLSTLENPEVFRTELEEAGFQEVRIEAVECFMRFDSPEDFWHGMVRGAVPLVLLRQRVGEAEFARQSELALEFLRQEIGEARRLSSTAYLAFARA